MRSWLILLLILPWLTLAATNKPTLRIVAPEIPNYTQSNGQGIYWNIIKAAFGQHYHLELSTASATQVEKLKQENYADAIVTIGNKDSDNTVFANQHIDIRHSVHLLYQPQAFSYLGLNSLDKKVLAVPKELHHIEPLLTSSRIYKVTSLQNLARLITKQRVDGILSYGYNVHYADPNQQLANIEIIPETPVYLNFPKISNGQRLANEFDLAIAKLIAANEIKQLFSSDADFLHAHLAQPTNNLNVPLTSIDWYVVPKMLSKVSNKLEPVELEVNFTKQLATLIPQLDVNLQVASSRVIFNKFKQRNSSDNQVTAQCVLNVSKNVEREQFALFSKPSYVFIAPRLLIIQGSQLAKQLATQGKTDIDLAQLLTTHPSLRIATINNQNTRGILGRNYSESVMAKLIAITDNSRRNMFSLLLSKRVDAIITWPAYISYALADQSISADIQTFGLSKLVDKKEYSYVACDKSPASQQVIEHINHIFTNPEQQALLYKETIATMDKQSALRFKQQLAVTPNR